MTLAEDRVLAQYRDHGFRRAVIRRDEAGFVYPIHYHAYNLVLQVLEGSMHVTTNKRRVEGHPGDHLHIPAGQLHTVHIGPSGCVYVHAEKEAARGSTRA